MVGWAAYISYQPRKCPPQTCSQAHLVEIRDPPNQESLSNSSLTVKLAAEANRRGIWGEKGENEHECKLHYVTVYTWRSEDNF